LNTCNVQETENDSRPDILTNLRLELKRSWKYLLQRFTVNEQLLRVMCMCDVNMSQQKRHRWENSS